MIPAPFDYDVAESVEHAISLLGSRDDTKVLAGGHSLLPLLRLRLARPSLLVDVGRLGDLSYVRDAGNSGIARNTAMARPREFNETAALEAAIACFWNHGYEATSVRDLAENMGLSPPSLYNAYGDKHALFVQALEHYLNRSMRERIERLENTLPSAPFPPPSSFGACSRRRSGPMSS